VFQLKGVEILAYDPAPSDQWRDEVDLDALDLVSPLSG
jgi:hypothetical protein